VSVRYDQLDDVEAALPRDYFIRAQLPWEAAFLAAKCFERYRRRGGVRTSALPDFFIGAHAAVAGMTLLTRDARRYRTYFPKLKIIAP
jgi:predicted nucleic acid-binding protein